jgi:MFS family permease
MFWLGVLPALLVLLLRRGVTDPPLYATRRFADQGFARIFRPDLLRVTMFGALLGLGNHGGYYALTTFLPTFLRSQRHLTVLSTGGYLAVFITASFVGYVTSGWLADRIGRRANIVVFAVLCCVSLAGYLLLPLSNTEMLVAGIPLGLFSAGVPAGLGPLYAELFPTHARGSGQGFCYNLGRIVSAVFPALVGGLSAAMGLAASIAVFAGVAYLIAILAVAFLPETKDRGLPDAPEEPTTALVTPRSTS